MFDTFFDRLFYLHLLAERFHQIPDLFWLALQLLDSLVGYLRYMVVRMDRHGSSDGST